MTSQSQSLAADDSILEPFRVRYGQHDLGLHVDIRVCLLRAGKDRETDVIVVSDTEHDDTSKDKGNDVSSRKNSVAAVEMKAVNK